jgi:NAD(P)H-dependent FMN reductase
MRGGPEQHMPRARPKLVIIVADAPGRSGATAVDWFVEQAWEHSAFDLDLVDLVDIGLPDLLTNGAPVPGSLDQLGPRLAAADALVVVLPEYNYSFPAPVKAAVDRFEADWAAKPVAFVSYGAVTGGLRAFEQLRLFVAEICAPTCRETVSVHRYWELLDAEGRPYDPEGCGRAAHEVLDHLVRGVVAPRTGTTVHRHVA